MNSILFFFRYDHFEIWSIDSNKRLVKINYQESNVVPLYFLISGSDISIGSFPKGQYLNGIGGTYGIFWKEVAFSNETIIRGVSTIEKNQLFGTTLIEQILPEICRNYFSNISLEDLLKSKILIFASEPFCDQEKFKKFVRNIIEIIPVTSNIKVLDFWKSLDLMYPNGNNGVQSKSIFAIGSYNSDLYIFNVNRQLAKIQDSHILLGKGVDPRLKAISDFCIEKILQRGSLVSQDELRTLIEPDTQIILNLLSKGLIEHPFKNPRIGVRFTLTIHKSMLESRIENPTDLLFIKDEVKSFYTRNNLEGSKIFILTPSLNIVQFYNQFEDIGYVKEDETLIENQLKTFILNYEKLVGNNIIRIDPTPGPPKPPSPTPGPPKPPSPTPGPPKPPSPTPGPPKPPSPTPGPPKPPSPPPGPPKSPGQPKFSANSDEQTFFDIILKSVGSNKLQVVKLVKELTGRDLKESKDLVDGVPSILIKSLTKAEAELFKIHFEEVGASIILVLS